MAAADPWLRGRDLHRRPWPGGGTGTRAQEGGADGRPADLHRRSARRVHPRLCFPDDARQCAVRGAVPARHLDRAAADRSEEHTSELQSLMRISYAVFCLKKKKLYTYII